MTGQEALKAIEQRSILIDSILGHEKNKRLYTNMLYYRADLIVLNNVDLASILKRFDKELDNE
jgi:Ni2+-binding GTPase involved in maturation of urease and hydrogenase